MKADKLYLVGFMGAGKSTTAAALGRRIGWRAEDIDATHARHAKVQYEHIRVELTHGLERRRAIAAAAYDLEIRLSFEELLQALQDDRVIIGQYQTRSCRRYHIPPDLTGNSNSTRDPVFEDSIINSPPSFAASGPFSIWLIAW